MYVSQFHTSWKSSGTPCHHIGCILISSCPAFSGSAVAMADVVSYHDKRECEQRIFLQCPDEQQFGLLLGGQPQMEGAAVKRNWTDWTNLLYSIDISWLSWHTVHTYLIYVCIHLSWVMGIQHPPSPEVNGVEVSPRPCCSNFGRPRFFCWKLQRIREEWLVLGCNV